MTNTINFTITYIKEFLMNLMAGLSYKTKGFILLITVSSAFGFIFYQMFIKKVNHKLLLEGNYKPLTQKQKDYINFNICMKEAFYSNLFTYSIKEKFNSKRNRIFESSNSTFKKLQNQKNLMKQTDQVFINILQKFTVFALKSRIVV